jgi:predicted metalloendopeptidase
MQFSRLIILLSMFAAVAWGQGRPSAGAAAIGPNAGPMQGFDLNALDRTANPCTDFYQFACGNWNANNPIPPDKSRWGRFDLLQERNLEILRGILEESADASKPRGPLEQRIGDHYASCVDEERIEKIGLKAFQPTLDRIRKISDRAQIMEAVAELHRGGVFAFFSVGSAPDFKESTKNIAFVDQAGLSMPDRDYYLSERFSETKQKYRAHVERMFVLLGETPDAAKEKAQAVLDIETELAKASLDRVSRRNANNVYHKMTRDELKKLAPAIGWDRYFRDMGAPGFDSLNVTVPDFFKSLDALAANTSLERLKTYLTWQALHASASLLPRAFVQEDFEFFGKTLTGAKEMQPRWRRCVAFTDRELGEALGRKYVERAFAGSSKQRVVEMVNAIERAFEKNLGELAWMTPATRQKALEKLHAVTDKMGYPEKWRDYTPVKIVRGDALGNRRRGDEFELRRRMAKIGTRVDPNEWRMTPPTVNAYYSPVENNINFPAGILQPPFFDVKLDDAVNFGAIGAVIGHELTHGFDDSGRRFDAAGNLRDWWTQQDAREFEKRAGCIIDQYGAYEPIAGVKLNGKLTVGENVADNGGVRMSYLALVDVLTRRPQGKIDGFTPEQRFFLGYGQIWCQNITDEATRLRATTDTHAPGRFRVNGVVSNSPEFQKAFGCTVGQPMTPQNACRVW